MIILQWFFGINVEGYAGALPNFHSARKNKYFITEKSAMEHIFPARFSKHPFLTTPGFCSSLRMLFRAIFSQMWTKNRVCYILRWNKISDFRILWHFFGKTRKGSSHQGVWKKTLRSVIKLDFTGCAKSFQIFIVIKF